MSEVLSLVAHLREDTGTGSARALRRNKMVPAIIYGAGKEPLSIAVEEKELTKYYRKPQYISQVIQFEIGGKKHKVLPKDVQLHPITEVVSHADFIFLDKKMQKMKVPLVYKNKEICFGVKKGGYFNIIKRFLNILCPVESMPRKIEFDVTDMAIATSMRAKEAKLPEGAKLLDDPNFVIASIIGKKGKTEDEPGAENAGESSAEAAAQGAK